MSVPREVLSLHLDTDPFVAIVLHQHPVRVL